jgi:5-methylcytosine-specific restriction endonuclease McrA
MSLMRRPVLQLNASYEPLRIISAKKALTLITKGVALVELPTSRMVYPGIYLPSVIRLRTYRHVPIRMQVASRKNIYIRDGHKCMYCGHSFVSQDLTLDHVQPKSQGGKNEWSNLVAACGKCNHRKANRTPEEAGMYLIRRPLPANIHTPRFVLKALGKEVQEWGPYLYSNSEGDQRFAVRG